VFVNCDSEFYKETMNQLNRQRHTKCASSSTCVVILVLFGAFGILVYASEHEDLQYDNETKESNGTWNNLHSPNFTHSFVQEIPIKLKKCSTSTLENNDSIELPVFIMKPSSQYSYDIRKYR